VVNVVGKPCLQTAERIITQRASTIDKPLIDSRHFRDVSMHGNEIAVRQIESNIRPMLLIKIFFELSEFHKY
jgi:hypothetical protein